LRYKSIILLALILLTTINTASALKEFLTDFNIVYNTSGTRLDSCELCHYTENIEKYSQFSGNLNPYGMKFKNNLKMEMGQAFTTLNNLKSDEDGFTNIEKIRNLKFPGDSKDKINVRTYNISGYVFDNNGKRQVRVKVQNGSYQNRTDSSGHLLITKIPNGTYNFRYSLEGFDTKHLEVLISGADNTSANITIYDTTSPHQVTELKNDIPTQTTVRLTWNSRNDANQYQVFRNGMHLGYTTKTYWKDTGLSPGTKYQYWVRANDSYNNWGMNSSILTIKTAADSIVDVMRFLQMDIF